MIKKGVQILSIFFFWNLNKIKIFSFLTVTYENVYASISITNNAQRITKICANSPNSSTTWRKLTTSNATTSVSRALNKCSITTRTPMSFVSRLNRSCVHAIQKRLTFARFEEQANQGGHGGFNPFGHGFNHGGGFKI